MVVLEYPSRSDTAGGQEWLDYYSWPVEHHGWVCNVVVYNPFNAGNNAVSYCWPTSWMCLCMLDTSLGLTDLRETYM